MGFGSHCVTSSRWCYSTEDYNEKQNEYTNIIEAKLIPEWFYWTYCFDCKKHRVCTNNVCPCQPTHKVSLLCIYCGNECFDYYNSYEYNPTSSHDAM